MIRIAAPVRIIHAEYTSEQALEYWTASPSPPVFDKSNRRRRILVQSSGFHTDKEAAEVTMEETAEQKLARLEAENRALKAQMEERKPGQLRLKVSEKGGLSVYGLGRFPVTLYKEQWVRLLDHADEIRSFLKDNDRQLKAKDQRQTRNSEDL